MPEQDDFPDALHVDGSTGFVQPAVRADKAVNMFAGHYPLARRFRPTNLSSADVKPADAVEAIPPSAIYWQYATIS